MTAFLLGKAYDKLFSYSLKKGKDFVYNSLDFNRILKQFNIVLPPEDNYLSLYIRTLLLLDDNKILRKFIPLLKNKEVYKSFVRAHQQDQKEIFSIELDHQLRTTQNHELKLIDKIPDALIDEIFNIFNKKINENRTPKETFDQLDHSRLLEKMESLGEQLNELNKTVGSKQFLPPQSDNEQNLLDKLKTRYQKDADGIFKEIKEGKIDSGLEKLIGLKEEIWDDIDDSDLKKSILKKIGYCFIEKKDFRSSIVNYEEALKLKEEANTVSVLIILYEQVDQQDKIQELLPLLEKLDSSKAKITKIRLGTSSQNLDELYSQCVDGQLKDEETLISLLQYFSRTKQYLKAYRVCISLVEHFDKIDYKEYAAEMALLYLQDKPIDLGINALTQEDQKVFEQAYRFIRQCSEYYRDKEIRIYKVNIFHFTAIFEMWAKKHTNALNNIEFALSLSASNHALLKTKGTILFKAKKYNEALEAYNQIPEDKDEDDIPLFKSRCYFVLDDIEQAKKGLRNALETISQKEAKSRAVEQLLSYYLFSEDTSGIEELLSKYKDCIAKDRIRLLEAKRQYQDGKIEQAKALLQELAMELIQENELTPLLFDVASDLEQLSEFSIAISLLEAFSKQNEGNQFYFDMLFRLYHKSEKTFEAVKICEKQRENGPNELFTQYEIKIYFNFPVYNKVVELGKSYIEKFPENTEIRLALIHSLLKTGDKPSAKRFLSYPMKIEGLDDNQARQLIGLHQRLNQTEEAFEIAYKLLAFHQTQFFNELYVGLSLHNDEFLSRIDTKEIVSNSTVTFEKDEQRFTKTFVDRPSESFLEEYYNEIPLTDPQYFHLYGKSTGTTDEQGSYKVIEIKHRYIYAFQKATTNLTQYKSQNIIKSFDASPLKEGKLPPEIKEILDQSERADIEFGKYLQSYEHGRIPLATLSKWFHKDIVELWFGITLSNIHFIRSSSGNINEFNSGVEYLKNSTSRKLIFDITSLLVIYQLGIVEEIKIKFDVYVLQDVIDYFETYKEMNSHNVEIESTRIIKNSDKIYSIKTTPADKQKELQTISKLIIWLKVNFEILSYSFLLDLKNSQIEKYSEIFDTITAKNLLVASESKLHFLCDDLPTNDILKTEFQKSPIWTQVLLNYLVIENIIERERYNDLTIDLVYHNIRYTHINDEIIYEAFRKEDFNYNKKTNKFLEILYGHNSDTSAFMVAFRFLERIKSTSQIPILKKQRIIFEVLFALHLSRVSYPTTKLIRKLALYFFRLDVIFRNHIEQQLVILSRYMKIFLD